MPLRLEDCEGDSTRLMFDAKVLSEKLSEMASALDSRDLRTLVEALDSCVCYHESGSSFAGANTDLEECFNAAICDVPTKLVIFIDEED